jgi:hypothetical protein
VLIEYRRVFLFFFFFFLNGNTYEFALIRNKLEGTPVLPVFVSEIDEEQPTIQFVDFAGYNMDFPDKPHQRKDSSQTIIEELR